MMAIDGKNDALPWLYQPVASSPGPAEGGAPTPPPAAGLPTGTAVPTHVAPNLIETAAAGKLSFGVVNGVNYVVNFVVNCVVNKVVNCIRGC